MVRQQIEEGMAPGTPGVIRSARPRATVPIQPAKTVASARLYNGPSSTVAVGEGAIVVTGSGDLLVDVQAKLRAWYGDPNQKISVTFKTADGEVEQKLERYRSSIL